MKPENLRVVLYWLFDMVLLAAIVFLIIKLNTWWPLFLVMMVPSRLPIKQKKEEQKIETKFN